MRCLNRPLRLVHLETLYFLRRKTRNSSEISLSQLWSNFTLISADISLKWLRTRPLARLLPAAQHLWINEVWHHGQIPQLRVLHLPCRAESCPVHDRLQPLGPPLKAVLLSLWIMADEMWHLWELSELLSAVCPYWVFLQIGGVIFRQHVLR